MSTTPIPMPQQQQSPQDSQQYLQDILARQSNTTGLTQMAPNLGGATPPTQKQIPGQQGMSNQRFGPGEGPARQRESMQNLVKAGQNLASQFAQKHQDKQNREYEQTITRFTGATQGVGQAQAQIIQATEALKKNPQDAQAQQQLQAAQGALKQNQTILNDLSQDKKHLKTITKAFGIDDKNAASPERQAAIQALKKQMGVGDKAAGVMSQIPQTQQLSPQAQAQSQAHQAGAVGAPATQGQVIQAISKAASDEVKKGIATDKLVPQLARAGLQMDLDENGQPARNEDGTLRITPMTPEQRALNPALRAQDAFKASQTALNEARAQAMKDPSNPQNMARMMNAQAAVVRSQAAMIHAQKYQPGAAGKTDTAGMGDLVDMFHRGELDPSQLPGFGKARTQFLEELHKRYPGDNPAQASEDYKFASNQQTQMTLKGLDNLVGPDGKTGNLQEVVKMSNAIKRTDFPAVNDVAAWAKINSGDPKMAGYYASILEVSDQIAKVLQGGSGGTGTSDAKLKQAQAILNSGFSKDQIKGIAESLGPLLGNRKSSMIGNNRYLKNQYGEGSGGEEVIVVSPEDMH